MNAEKESKMTNEELAREIAYALIRAGHMHDSVFSAASRLIKERLDNAPAHKR